MTLRNAFCRPSGLALRSPPGCGSDEEPASSRSSSPSSAFPVKIEHALGTTTIPAEPKRVVVVGYTDQEPLLALGVRPVGAMDWFGQGTFAQVAVGARGLGAASRRRSSAASPTRSTSRRSPRSAPT